MKKITRVTHVAVTIFKTHPPTLGIFASGLVPTSGFTSGTLVPYIYIAPPADGIYDFDFIAREPDGMAAEVISVVTASYSWRDYPGELKGVRIHAAVNALVDSLEEAPHAEAKLF